MQLTLDQFVEMLGIPDAVVHMIWTGSRLIFYEYEKNDEVPWEPYYEFDSLCLTRERNKNWSLELSAENCWSLSFKLNPGLIKNKTYQIKKGKIVNAAE